MKIKNFWIVEKTHLKEAYNDVDEYSIKDGSGKVIVMDDDVQLLNTICNKHNICFMEDE